MNRKPIPLPDLVVRSHHLWAEHWLVLASGDFMAARFNAMAVGWGSLGTMWGKAFAQVVVRPGRYTFEFMEQYDAFTLSAFPERHRTAVEFLGTRSGRDSDKVAESGLTPVAASVVAAPCFAEAELVLECRKIYWQDMDPTHFLTADIEGNYPQKDYHRIYFGQIVAASGVDAFRA